MHSDLNPNMKFINKLRGLSDEFPDSTILLEQKKIYLNLLAENSEIISKMAFISRFFYKRKLWNQSRIACGLEDDINRL